MSGHGPADEERDRRAEQADRDADQRDVEAARAARAAEERDRRAALRDMAAADRHLALLSLPDSGAVSRATDSLTGMRPRDDAPTCTETDRDERRRRVLAEAAGLEFEELLDKLAICYARWQAVLHELHALTEDRAAAAEDRRLAADDRQNAHRARQAGVADRAGGAADRHDHEIEHGRRPHHLEPAVLRRALKYIDDHAGDDIGIDDIASHAQIGARGLQHTFRTHRHCTPMEHLRRVRMHRAHEALQTADSTQGDTVAAISARWHFSNPGRFATQYRAVYGYSPNMTLRR